MATYLFHLGREPELSTAELQAVFSATGIKATLTPHTPYTIVETDKQIDSEALMQQLGGTIKIAERVDESIQDHITTHQPDGKIQFALNDKKKALTLKKELKATGRNVRYIEIKNTATILHNNLVDKQSDYTLTKDDLFVTRAIQPIEQLSERDYGRPKSDSKSGMLPPKLARMMINLAGKNNDEATILDPFCGSGTVLMEAALLGFKHIVGSDLSQKAVEDTKANLTWICEQYKITRTNQNIQKVDVKELSAHVDKESIDTIVSEPFMGNPLRGNESKQQLIEQATALGNLYADAFAQFATVLKRDGVIIFIIPSFKWKDEWVTIDCVNTIKKAGFTPVPFGNHAHLVYHRPDQFVARNIWQFVKTS